MFPFVQSGFHESFPSDQSRNRPPSRLDIQRQHLEHRKMYHLNTMVVDQSLSNLDRQLAHRQQILEATADQLSLSERLRQRVASILIATGQRIEPASCPQEPQFNA